MFLRTLTSSLARRPKRFAVAVLAVAMGVGIAKEVHDRTHPAKNHRTVPLPHDEDE